MSFAMVAVAIALGAALTSGAVIAWPRRTPMPPCERNAVIAATTYFAFKAFVIYVIFYE